MSDAATGFATPQTDETTPPPRRSSARRLSAVDMMKEAHATADVQRRRASAAETARTEATAEVAGLKAELEAARAAHAEQLAAKTKEVTEWRTAYRKEKQQVAFVTELVTELEKKLADQREEFELSLEAMSTAAARTDGAVGNAKLRAEARGLRLGQRALRDAARHAARVERMVGGAAAHEVVYDAGASLLAWSKRAKLVARGLRLSDDRRRLLVADSPNATSLVFDRAIKLDEIERVSFGVDGHAELPPLWEALADAAPPRWRCLTIVYGDGKALHLVADDDEAAVAWALGLQRCAATRRAEAAAAGGGGGGDDEEEEGGSAAGGGAGEPCGGRGVSEGAPPRAHGDRDPGRLPHLHGDRQALSYQRWDSEHALVRGSMAWP